MWVARNKYRGLYLFENKPERNQSTLTWVNGGKSYEIDFDLFEDVYWVSEPLEISYEIAKKLLHN